MALVTTPCPQVRVTLEGFEGDKHSGLTYLSGVRTPHYPRGTVIRNTRQISIVSTDELDLIAAALGVPAVLPEWLGANLAIRGIPDLTQLPPSTRLFFPQDTVLVVDGENMPCVFLGTSSRRSIPPIRGLARQFPKVAIHRRGVVAWVERPGLVAEGDRVVARIPPQVIYSIPAGPCDWCVRHIRLTHTSMHARRRRVKARLSIPAFGSSCCIEGIATGYIWGVVGFGHERSAVSDDQCLAASTLQKGRRGAW